MGSYSRAFLRLTLPQHNFHNESLSRPDVPGGQPRQPRQLCSTIRIRKVWLWRSWRRKQFQTIPKLYWRELPAEQPEHQLQQPIVWKINDASISPPIVGQIV